MKKNIKFGVGLVTFCFVLFATVALFALLFPVRGYADTITGGPNPFSSGNNSQTPTTNVGDVNLPAPALSPTVPAVDTTSYTQTGTVQTNPSQTGTVQTPSATGGISNPLKVNSIQDLISAVLKFVVNLLAIAGVLYIIWTGFLFVKAQGNEKELETAKKSFTHAIIGMAIILGAWAIATAIANTINQVTNNNNVTFKAQ